MAFKLIFSYHKIDITVFIISFDFSFTGGLLQPPTAMALLQYHPLQLCEMQASFSCKNSSSAKS